MDSRGVELVVRVDDAGLSEGVNHAIVEALRGPVARSVSVMAAAPAAAHAAGLLGSVPGAVCGLHVTLTSEWEQVRWGPVLPPARVPSLVDADGLFLRTTAALQERGGADPDEAAAEITAQLGRLRGWGLTVRYLDEHMGVGWVDGVGPAVRAVAAAEGLLDADRRAAPLLLPATGDTAAALPAAVRACPPGGPRVLITHPGFDDPALRALRGTGFPDGGVGLVRDADRRMLTDGGLWEAVRAAGAVFTDFARLAP
ncbi:carbohydrate deacetylase [Kitasatospora indigofera]|uniref:carbohydrate deacetylase n=1 Tax=Kitasatospora indigofera TaxID=67307 RepID=UPI0036B669FE